MASDEIPAQLVGCTSDSSESEEDVCVDAASLNITATRPPGVLGSSG